MIHIMFIYLCKNNLPLVLYVISDIEGKI
jgi:hypothetical protein